MPFNPDKLRQAGEQADYGEPILGHHIVAVTDSSAFTAKSGRDFCKLTLRVHGGAHNGHEWDLLMTVDEDSPGLGITHRQLKTLGVDLSGIDGLFALDDELRRFHGRTYEVEVERNGQYVNTWIRGEQTQLSIDQQQDVPIDTGDLVAAPASAATAASADDEAPF